MIKRKTGHGRVLRLCVLCALATACERAPAEHGVAATIRPDTALWYRMLAAEDARGRGDEGISPLIEGIASRNPALRRIAVRALGRLEVDSLVPTISPLLQDNSAEVRAEAANALGQAVLGGVPGAARAALMARFEPEADARVRGVIAETLGRLRHASAAEVAATVNLLVATPVQSASLDGEAFMLGAARGLYFLLRQPVGRDSLPESALIALRNLIRFGLEDTTAIDTLAIRRVRSVSAAAMAASRRAAREDVSLLMRDPAPLVRREAVLAAMTFPAEPAAALVDNALNDASPIVRFEALRALRTLRQPRQPCPQVLNAVSDADAHVRILALSTLGEGCGGPAAVELLDSVTASLAPSADSVTAWQEAATALTSLAAVNAGRARRRLSSFVASANPFVRVYAARAAARLRDTAVLTNLAADPHPNVRSVAVPALFARIRHRADPILIRQLQENDSQLLQVVADSLTGTRSPRALPALLDAFDRISAARRETWRDARIALLRRIDELGARRVEDRLRPYLQDYDPRVATAIADMLGRRTGTRPAAAPASQARLELPSFAALDSLERSTAILETSAGTIELRLLPFDAPTNVSRFVRLAREGYYDGLTFHRVEPNFVLQGGSPGANEYAGDGPYTRDELGRPNWRGTVGLSTRGRDTGDAQIFINLIDNIRLDYNYTVFAEITHGFEVMDRILEGETIHRITLRAGG